MDYLITYDEAVALVANPPTLAPRPNFTNLCALHRHLQRALQRLVNPQSNVLGWSGLVMSRPMYQMLSTSPFRLPTDPGPQAVYFGARTPILNANGFLSLTHMATQGMLPSLLSIAPPKRRSTLILYVSKTTGSRTRSSREHATTCLTKPSTMHSSSPLTPTSRDGIHQWKSSKSWNK
jgi:hypothetical protein